MIALGLQIVGVILISIVITYILFQLMRQINSKVKFFLILIDDPKYDTQNVSHTAIKIKEEIRSIYKPKIENYYKDIIVHISDNHVEAGNIYKLIL